jgi:hypothetical protein
MYADLRWALRVWREEPMLPLLTVLVEIAAYLPLATQFLGVGIPLQLALCGWVGTQRVWYLRASLGTPLRLDEVPRLTYRFLGRYLALSLLGGIPIAFVAFGFGLGSQVRDSSFDVTAAATILFTVTFLVADALATFITPALAFTTWRVSEAVAIGWSMLRQTWPRCAWYVLIPPLAAQMLLRFRPESVGLPAATAIMALTALVALAFKGATAAFYLRQRPAISEDGAAFDGPHARHRPR